MARSPSPKPRDGRGARTAGTPGRTAVSRKGSLAWTSATANRKDASRDLISRGADMRGWLSSLAGVGAFPAVVTAGLRPRSGAVLGWSRAHAGQTAEAYVPLSFAPCEAYSSTEATKSS